MLEMAVIYLAAAIVAVPIAKRLGLGSVLGYLMAGILIGPSAFALVGDQTDVMHFAEFGVVMMLFLVGLELQPSRLWKLRHSILGLGGLQVVLTTLSLFGLACYGLNLRWETSLAIGLMLALSFAAVPLYDLFCRVTGFGGTTQNASEKEIPKIIVNRNYKMRFDTNVHSTSDWKFYPEKNTLDLKPGQVHTVKFNVENPSNQTSSGSASFNVSPSSFGKYLNKIGCFCFEKQTLKPNEKQEFVLTFFLDPKVVDDNKTKNISDVTLSFTFFASEFYEKGKI